MDPLGLETVQPLQYWLGGIKDGISCTKLLEDRGNLANLKPDFLNFTSAECNRR